ncbi:DUF4097 family beta strand repeat-containing protein [Streptococcus dentiloxodontae]
MKKLLTAGGLCIGIGLIFALATYFITGGQLNSLKTEFQLEPRQEIFASQDVRQLDVDVTSFDIQIIGTDQDKVTVDYAESRYTKFQIKTENGQLSIRQQQKGLRSWVRLDGLLDLLTNNEDNTVKIKVPQKILNQVYLQSSSGNVEADNLDINGNWKTTVISGNTSLSNLSAQNMTLSSISGNQDLNQVSAKESFQANLTSGNLTVNRLNVGKSILFKLTSGNAKGTVLGNINDYNFDTNAISGNNNLPKERTGGHKNFTAELMSGNLAIDFTE